MKIRNIIIALTLLTLAASAAWAQDADERAQHIKQRQLEQKTEQLARIEQRAAEVMERAREALNRERFREAAREYARAFELIEHERQAGDALYWQAFARYRLQKSRELKIAVELLHRQQEQYSQSETAAEGRALMARLQAELARRGDPGAARDIEELADDEDDGEETRIYALHALMEMNPDRALPLLQDIVSGKKGGSEEFRRNAVFVLCRVDDPRSEEILIDMLRTTEDPEMLSELVMCLSMKDSDRALDALVDLFRSSDDAEIDEAALFAIGRHGGDRAYGLLAEIVRDRNADMEQRQHALFGLSHAGRDDEVAELALEILRGDEHRELQEMALMTLSQVDSEVSSDVFVDLIRNDNADDELRAQALFFAAQHGDVGVDFLEEVYRNAEGEELKMQVCHVLTTLDDEDAALDLLIEIARTEDSPEIRQNAVFWVSRFDDDRAAEFLYEVINGE